ncbi:hypothetical protein VTL71DRAFT_7640 [Oculimacula yallundae]|uniref:Cyclochlorotine biosynthesis protein O n=1 Tax=Oculimacula yallundae TaxID=86028 RepID=A0ABR4BVI2_9HELO
MIIQTNPVTCPLLNICSFDSSKRNRPMPLHSPKHKIRPVRVVLNTRTLFFHSFVTAHAYYFICCPSEAAKAMETDRRGSQEAGRFELDCHNMECDEDSLLEKAKPAQILRQNLLARLGWIAQGTFFLLSVLVLILATKVKPTDIQCAKQLSPYSPILEDQGVVEYSSYDLELYFNQPSPYRGIPTPEREALWEDLWHKGAIEVPIDKLAILNKTDTGMNYKHVPESIGTGYVAQVEVLHQLHCVGMLRKWSYKEYWTDRGLDLPGVVAGKNPALLRMHLDHCLEVLRLNIMCTSDTTPILIELDPKAPFGERADFRTNHKCRNFWAIHKWVEEHTAIP